MSDGRATLRLGDHVCASYTTDRQCRDAFTGFARDGVRDGQKVLCFVAAANGVPAALGAWLAAAVPTAGPGQVRIVAVGDEIRRGGRIDYASLTEGIVREVDFAQQEGYPGLRLVGDLGRALLGGYDLDELVDYEAAVNGLFGDARAIAVCQYDLRRFDPAAFRAIAAAHPGTLTEQGGRPLLRFAFAPRGLSLDGQVDASNRRAFAAVLARLSTIDGRVTVDATELCFVDVAGAVTLLALAAARGPRATVVRCRARIDKALRLAGSACVPGLDIDLVP